jgi:two-component system OmpR family response regulator/two-component system response regulator QseB
MEVWKVPVVLVGDGEQLRVAGGSAAIEVGVPSPADGAEIANAARIAAGEDPRPLRVTELGPLRLDLAQRVAAIDGRVLKLPPREFSILAELALHPKEPIAPGELARRIRPHCSMSAEDIRRCVYRLRRLIGDHFRVPPLISTRRGFGYVLEPYERMKV